MDFDFVANASSIKEMELLVSLDSEFDKLYQEVLYDVRRDIVYQTNNNWENYDKYEKQIREGVEYGFKYSFDNLKKSLPRRLQELLNNEKILQFNRMKCIARASLLLGIDYKTYKELENFSSKGINTDDKEALEFLEQFEKIKNGEQFDYIIEPIPDIITRLKNIYEENYNKIFTKINTKKKIDNDEIKDRFGLTDIDTIGIEFIDSGVEFAMPIKSIGYGYRIGDNCKAIWDSDDTNYLFEAKSFIREDSINIFLSESSLLEENWIVGYEQLHKLEGMGSHDIDSNTNENKEYISGRKPCRNFSSFCSPDELIYNTGILDDDNHPVFSPYNEIDDNKYENEHKVMPDYLIFPFSSNNNSKFSKYQKERLKKAIKAAKELGNNTVLIMDMDKIVKSEFTKVESLKEKYIETKDIRYLKELLVKIHNNRKGPYSSNVFTNEYLFSLLSNIYDFSNEEVMNVIDDEMYNMTNISPDTYEKFVSDLKKQYCKEKQEILDEISNIIKDIKKKEDLINLITSIQQEQLETITGELEKLNSKLIKSKKIKSSIKEKENKLNELKQLMIKEVEEKINNQLKKVGFPVIDFQNRESIESSLQKAYEIHEEFNHLAEIKNDKNKPIVLDTRSFDLNLIIKNMEKLKCKMESNELSDEKKKSQ